MFEVGDKVTYHGSLEEYHPYVFHITAFLGEHKHADGEVVEWVSLQGPTHKIWIQQCRVSSISPYDGEFDYYHDREYDGEYFDNTVWLNSPDEIEEYLRAGVI